MCSAMPPNLFSPDAAGAVVGAIGSVAERSFFADVAECDPATFDERAAEAGSWLIATVHFREGEISGLLSCTLPRVLARALLDAFTGRDPHDPEPDPESLFDLAGEFSNMICGTWLTRMAAAQAFTLSRPLVELADARPTSAAMYGWTLMTVNDWPMAVSVSGVGADSPAAGVSTTTPASPLASSTGR